MRGSNHLTDRELLMALDGELPIAQRASTAAHLEQCLDCQTRREQVARAAEDYSTLYRSDLAAPAEVNDQARERLRAQLEAIGRTPRELVGLDVRRPTDGDATVGDGGRGARGDGVDDSSRGPIALASIVARRGDG